MPVRVLPLASGARMSAAIGFLEPGARYAVHYHRTLEQLTFVTRGEVEVTMDGVTRRLGVGEAMTNPARARLSFANPGSDAAEVLFVCTPPFPADASEVVLMDGHRA